MELQLQNGAGSVEVSDMVFGGEFKQGLVHQVVTAYLAAGRSGTKAQKTRSEVSGGGLKPWRQKGTGRARAGTTRGPLWRKGGVTFAAEPRDYTQKVNKKMYRGAMRAILSELNRDGRLVVVDQIAVEEPKTKLLAGKLGSMGLSDVLIVAEDVEQNLYLAARNIPSVGILDVAGLDPVSLMSYDKVMMTVGAVRACEEWLA